MGGMSKVNGGNLEDGLTVIQEDTKIKGEIRNGKRIELHGYVEGEVIAEQVNIHPSGRLYGTLRTHNVDVHGTVQGEAYIKDLCQIHSSGAVSGNLEYGQLAMEAGGDLSADLQNVAPEIGGDLDVSVSRGKAVTITTADLSAFDPDDAAKDLTFNISKPVNGFVALSSAPKSAVTRFTQVDLESGHVLFVHDGSQSGEGAFEVVVSDAEGATSGEPQTLQVAVKG